MSVSAANNNAFGGLTVLLDNGVGSPELHAVNTEWRISKVLSFDPSRKVAQIKAIERDGGDWGEILDLSFFSKEG